jgi:hypothetical protein
MPLRDEMALILSRYGGARVQRHLEALRADVVQLVGGVSPTPTANLMVQLPHKRVGHYALGSWVQLGPLVTMLVVQDLEWIVLQVQSVQKRTVVMMEAWYEI